MKVYERDGNFVVEERTSAIRGGKRVGSDEWKSVWSPDYSLLSMSEKKLGDLQEKGILDNKKSSYHRKALLTMKRHLRALKMFRGEEYNISKGSVKTDILFVEPSCKYEIRAEQAAVTNTTVRLLERKPRALFRRADILFVEVTEENRKILDEYNSKLKDFDQYRQSVSRRLFDRIGVAGKISHKREKVAVVSK